MSFQEHAPYASTFLACVNPVPEDINFFMLNSAVHEIDHAHKF